MKEIMVLKKKKESLLSRLFGIKSQAEKEEIARTHREEIQSLETEIKTVDQMIFDSLISEVKEKVKGLEAEAEKLTQERTDLRKRMEEIDQRLIDLFYLASEIIPKKRRQVSSQRTVKMFREVTEAEFTGLFKSSELAYEGGMPVGHKLAPAFDLHKRTIEIQVPAFQGQVEHARSLGYELKAGEKLEEEALTDKNSVWVPIVQMPDVLSQ